MFLFRRMKQKQQEKQDPEEQEFNEYIEKLKEKVNPTFLVLQAAYLQYGYNENTGEIYEKKDNSIITDVSKILFVKTCYASIAKYWGQNYKKFPNKEAFINDMLCGSDVDQHSVFNNGSYKELAERGNVAFLLSTNAEERICNLGMEKRNGTIIELPIQSNKSYQDEERYFYSNTGMIDLQIAVARQWLREKGRDIKDMSFTICLKRIPIKEYLFNYFEIGDSLNNDYMHQFKLVEKSVGQLEEYLIKMKGNDYGKAIMPENRVEPRKTFKDSLNADNPQWNQTTSKIELTPEERLNRYEFVKKAIKYYDMAESDELYQRRSENEEERMQQIAYIVNNNERMGSIKNSIELFQILKAAQNLSNRYILGKTYLDEILDQPEVNKALVAFKSSGAAKDLREQALENKKNGYKHKLTDGEIDKRAMDEFLVAPSGDEDNIKKSIESKFKGEDNTPYTREEKGYISFKRVLARRNGMIPGDMRFMNGEVTFMFKGNAKTME